MTNNINPSDRIIRWPELLQRIGLCRSYIHLLINRGDFPSQIKLGTRASGFLESQVDSWIAERVAISSNTCPKKSQESKHE